jgi:CheY-like chemotaxis protein
MPKILAIDDKEDNLITISAVLKSFVPDCQVITAQSGREGIKKAKSESPDTILLDIKMPQMDGYEVCERLKENEDTKHIPVLMITAIKTDPKGLVIGLESGADAYLAKPIDESVLIAQVNTALRVKQAEDQLRNQKNLLEEMVLARTAELTKTNKLLEKEIEEHRQAEKEKKRVETELIQAQKKEAIGTLAGGIAHDFNNILTSIIGYSDLAKMRVQQGDDVTSDLDQIRKSGDRAKTLVQQIVTVGRKQEQEPRPIQIGYIVKEALGLLRAALPSTIEIREVIPKNIDIVHADPTQMHQVVMNLGTNAGQAMNKKGGALDVELENVSITEPEMNLKPGLYVKLTVRDTGDGMKPEVIERIFEPYFTTKEMGEGTGLGLSVVQGIVVTHGGAIMVESNPGGGSTFHVYLPRTEQPEKISETKTQKPLPTGTERILFVDDEPTLLDMVGQILKQLGYQVVTTNGSFEALELFRKDPDRFDLVITDMTMPKMTGIALARELLNTRPNIPIILCSGSIDQALKGKAQAAGIREFLAKPISMGSIAQTVKKVLN